MLNLKEILNNSENVKNKIKTRGFDISIVDKVIKLGKIRLKKIRDLDNKRLIKNNISSNIAVIKKNNGNIDVFLLEVSKIKKSIKKLHIEVNVINKKINELLLFIPNIPLKETPIGENKYDNQVVKEFDELGRGKVDCVKSHYDIAKALDIIDIERAVKISGTRFVAYKGDGSKLLRALKSFMLDKHISNGYVEYTPPVLVNKKAMIGTGQLPKFTNDLFKIEGYDKWLIPTAEVPLTNIYSNEIISLNKTKSITAYTSCFRAESGSGGKDNRGLIRLHQFHKIELVKIARPDQSQTAFDNLKKDAEVILKDLELPYRILLLCSKDIGFSANRTVDLEVWMPSEKKYREISSISSFGDYQSRRAMIRFKNKEGKNEYVHTVNGSGLAIDRCIAAILENYQNKDGTITIPKVLVSYMGKKIIK